MIPMEEFLNMKAKAHKSPWKLSGDASFPFYTAKGKLGEINVHLEQNGDVKVYTGLEDIVIERKDEAIETRIEEAIRGTHKSANAYNVFVNNENLFRQLPNENIVNLLINAHLIKPNQEDIEKENGYWGRDFEKPERKAYFTDIKDGSRIEYSYQPMKGNGNGSVTLAFKNKKGETENKFAIGMIGGDLGINSDNPWACLQSLNKNQRKLERLTMPGNHIPKSYYSQAKEGVWLRDIKDADRKAYFVNAAEDGFDMEYFYQPISENKKEGYGSTTLTLLKNGNRIKRFTLSYGEEGYGIISSDPSTIPFVNGFLEKNREIFGKNLIPSGSMLRGYIALL